LSEHKRSGARLAPGRGRPVPDKRGRYVVKPEWIRADTAINAGFIVVGVYIVQALIGTGVADPATRLSIIAWAVAIPLLAALAMLNLVREWYRYTSYPLYWSIAWIFAHGAALVGLVAAIWHVWFPAAIVLMISGAAGFAVYQISVRRLERDNSSD
jgi:hypothetical protein